MAKKLNFGCGNDIRKGWDNVDIQKSKKLTKSFDFNKFPYPIRKDSYDYIYLSNVLEHLDKPYKVLDELWRIAKNKAIIEIIVPHYTNKGAYSDMQYQHFFNEECFELLEKQRKLIDKTNKFKIKELKLIPTLPGKFFPRFLREKLSLFINGLISQIRAKIQVNK